MISLFIEWEARVCYIINILTYALYLSMNLFSFKHMTMMEEKAPSCNRYTKRFMLVIFNMVMSLAVFFKRIHEDISSSKTL